MNKSLQVIFIIYLLCCSPLLAQQSDSLIPFESYKRRLVLYTDFGYNTAPMSLHYNFDNGMKKIKVRNYFKPIVGFGFAYRWMALHFNIALPNSSRTKEEYGNSRYLDLGVDFSFKNMYFDINWHLYQGFAMKNAHLWNDTIQDKSQNLIRQDLNSYSFSIDAYQFWNDYFKMFAFKGRTASYQRDIRTFYLKYISALHGISSANPIIPTELQDTLESKTRSTAMGSIDFGIVPGYAYVRRWRAFQLGILGGFGLAIQNKYYTFDGQNRTFLGLAPRFDFKMMGGINKPRYFIMLIGDFDTKSIRFNDLTHIQTYYNIKLALGLRLHVTKKKEAKELEYLQNKSSEETDSAI